MNAGAKLTKSRPNPSIEQMSNGLAPLTCTHAKPYSNNYRETRTVDAYAIAYQHTPAADASFSEQRGMAIGGGGS